MPDLIVWVRNYPRNLLEHWVDPREGDHPRMREYVRYLVRPNLFQVDKPTWRVVSRIRDLLITYPNDILVLRWSESLTHRDLLDERDRLLEAERAGGGAPVR